MRRRVLKMALAIFLYSLFVVRVAYSDQAEDDCQNWYWFYSSCVEVARTYYDGQILMASLDPKTLTYADFSTDNCLNCHVGY